MEYQYILFEQRDDVARISLNRPRLLNALNRLMLDEMLDALRLVRDAGACRVLLISAEGRGFCSGADLSPEPEHQSTPLDCGSLLETHYNPLLERMFDLPVPVIAAVNGVAAGGGCSLALCADFAIAGRSAYFTQAFVNIGLVPDVGSTWLLPRLVGRARAQTMMMLGEKISAEQAYEWGMIYKVVDDEQLSVEAQSLALRLAKGPTVAYKLIRQGLRQALDQSLTESLMSERRRQLVAGRTHDFIEGVSAFNEKRTPKFRGK